MSFCQNGAIVSPTASPTSPAQSAAVEPTASPASPAPSAAVEPTASPASPAPSAAEQQAAPEQQEQQLMLEDHQELTPEEQEQEDRANYFATGVMPATMQATIDARIYQERFAPNQGRNEDGIFSMKM